MLPEYTGSSKLAMQGRSSEDSMMIVTGWSTAPAGMTTPAWPCSVTMVVLVPGWAVPSPQSESERSHCEPTPMKNLIGSVRSSSNGLNGDAVRAGGVEVVVGGMPVGVILTVLDQHVGARESADNVAGAKIT